jgi:hypothetical protein
VVHAKNLPKGDSSACVVMGYLTGPKNLIDEERSKRQSTQSDDNVEEPSSPLPEPEKEVEIVRTSGAKDLINPNWEEVFQASVRYAEAINVTVYDKRFWSTKDVLAKGKIDLIKNKKQYLDNQSHDVWVSLEPQGRLLVRILMEGENEDIGFYFRKTHERFKRVQDDYVRFLVSRVIIP